MNREKAIKALLQRSKSQFDEIRSEYDRSLHDKSVSDLLKVDIKNLFENLRSVLDYMANSIREDFCPDANPKTRFYFPVFSDNESFIQRMAQWFPGLQERNPELYNYLQSIQPFNSKYSWLGAFNKINNENKHDSLVEQTRTETTRISAQSGTGRVEWDPSSVRFGSGVYINGVPVNPSTQMPAPSPSQTVTKTIWVDFQFQGHNQSAIKLMQSSLNGVTELFKNVDQRM